jgi:hypothetical protein
MKQIVSGMMEISKLRSNNQLGFWEAWYKESTSSDGINVDFRILHDEKGNANLLAQVQPASEILYRKEVLVNQQESKKTFLLEYLANWSELDAITIAPMVGIKVSAP